MRTIKTNIVHTVYRGHETVSRVHLNVLSDGSIELAVERDVLDGRGNVWKQLRPRTFAATYALDSTCETVEQLYYKTVYNPDLTLQEHDAAVSFIEQLPGLLNAATYYRFDCRDCKCLASWLVACGLGR